MHTNYTTIKCGSVLLWRTGCNTPTATLCRNALSAVVYGDEVVVANTNGSTTVYRITSSRTSAYPVRTLH